jgi:hypothetical protein
MNTKQISRLTGVIALALAVIGAWVAFRSYEARVPEQASDFQQASLVTKPTQTNLAETTGRSRFDDSSQSDPLRDQIIEEAIHAGATQEQVAEIERGITPIKHLVQAFTYPIVFYGKVVDENGAPVDEAEIRYSAFNRFFQDSKKQVTHSDGSGSFSIRDITGGTLFVSVNKDGYYQTKESQKDFGYALPSDNPPAPDPNSPAFFVLRKKGIAEPLVYVKSRQYKVPRDGSLISIDLKKGEHSPDDNAPFIVQSWVSAEDKDDMGRFDWRFKFAAPSGGFLKRTNEFSFVAPEDGYVEFLEFAMTKNMKEDWKRGDQGEYFVKLKDDMYGRVHIKLYPNEQFNMFTMESFLNPSGSRNLEYDPKKTIGENRP